MSKIVLNHEDKEYVLEYNRQSVKMMEGQGFVLDELVSKPMTMIPLLFSGAFIKNCKGTKRNVIDEIFKGISDKNELLEALMEMYTETLSTLTDSADEGNVTWTLQK
jgi:hypothetical protein